MKSVKSVKSVVALICFVFLLESILLNANYSTVDASTQSVNVKAIAGAVALPLDVKKTVTFTEDERDKLFSFTPSVTGSYKVESFGVTDTGFILYDEENRMDSYNNDSGEDYNFKCCFDLLAGKTYTLYVQSYDGAGSCEVLLTRLTKMEIVSPTLTTYYVGTEELDFEGLSATLYYSNGTNETMNTDNVIEQAYYRKRFEITYGPVKLGLNTVNISYGGFTKSFTVNGVTLASPMPSCSPITLDKVVDVSTTKNGEPGYYSFVPTLSGDYNFESSYLSGIVYISVFDASGNLLKKDKSAFGEVNTYYLQAGKTYYIVSKMPFNTGSYSFTCTQVKEVDKLQVVRMPIKTEFLVDYDYMNLEGLRIKIYYKDGTSEVIYGFEGMRDGNWNGYYVGIEGDDLKEGDNVIKVTYRGKAVSFTLKGVSVLNKYSNASIIPGVPDTTLKFSLASRVLVRKFIPTVSGQYIFETNSQYSMGYVLYNNYGEYLYSIYPSEDNNGRYPSKYARYLEKDKVYYIVMYNDCDYSSNSLTLGIRTATAYTVPKGISAVYGQTLGQIALPKGFSWEDKNIRLNSVGQHIFTAKYTPTDGRIISVVSGIRITVNVKPPVYKITYKLTGGVNNKSNPNTYGLLTKNITLGKPSRKGYEFAGWYADAKYRKAVNSIAKTSKGAITLYAKWNKITLKQGSIKGLLNKKSGLVVASYSKLSKVKGYQVVYSTDKKFKNAKYKLTTKTSFSLSKCKKGTTYYFKVRGYTVDSAGKMVYGKYSSTKSIKVSR